MTQEQQIEAMAYVLCGGCNECYKSLCADWYRAERLYKAGYRKQIDGEWIFNRGRCYGEPAYYCSLCNEGASEYGMDNFCPNCGAKMKGECL